MYAYICVYVLLVKYWFTCRYIYPYCTICCGNIYLFCRPARQLLYVNIGEGENQFTERLGQPQTFCNIRQMEGEKGGGACHVPHRHIYFDFTTCAQHLKTDFRLQ